MVPRSAGTEIAGATNQVRRAAGTLGCGRNDVTPHQAVVGWLAMIVNAAHFGIANIRAVHVYMLIASADLMSRPRIAEIRARYEQLLKKYPMIQGHDQAGLFTIHASTDR